MGAAASTLPLPVTKWQAKPCEVFNAGGCEVSERWERVRSQYMDQYRAGADPESLEESGSALLLTASLKVGISDEGSWTRITVTDMHATTDNDDGDGGDDKFTLFPEIGHRRLAAVEGLVRSSSHRYLEGQSSSHPSSLSLTLPAASLAESPATAHVFVCFTDGSDASHRAFAAASALIRPGSDQLTTVTVESEKLTLSSKFKVGDGPRDDDTRALL